MQPHQQAIDLLNELRDLQDEIPWVGNAEEGLQYAIALLEANPADVREYAENA